MLIVFHYDGRHDATVVGSQEMAAPSLEAAALQVMLARRVTWIHVRTVDGVTVGRRFEYIPPPY